MEFFANLYTNLTQSAVAADRIFEFLDTRSPIQDAPNARDLKITGPPPVVFEDVKFAYPDAPDTLVLKGISFEARPGDRVVLVGGSGSGKSSTMNLLMRFYDVTDGAIRINGQDLRLITTHSLRDHIGIVPQQPILFRGTLRDNILYGRRGASDDELHAAARQANAEKFILDFPRRLRHSHRRTRGTTFRRTGATYRHRARLSQKPRHPHHGRSDLQSRCDERNSCTRCVGQTGRRPHDVHHRASS
jgi:ABC-type multidrug transport system fused ATPase/permease subunit